MKYVSENYNHLINLNNISFGQTLRVKAQINPRFFVIKSFTEEDIHKVISHNFSQLNTIVGQVLEKEIKSFHYVTLMVSRGVLMCFYSFQ